MIKRASTILLTLFLLLTSAQVWADNMTSATTFQKKDDVTGEYYELSDIKITPPFINQIKTAYTYTNSTVEHERGLYTVTSDGAYFGYKGSGNDKQPKSTFITIPFDNLVINKTYTFIIKLKIEASANDGDGMKFNVGFNGINKTSPTFSPNNNCDSEEGGKRIKLGKYETEFTITYKLTPTSTSGSYSLGWEWDDKDKIYGVLISHISIEGELEPTVLSENGYEICRGEENKYTAIGKKGPFKWEYSNDNKATWKLLTTETTESVTADLQDEFFYVRATGIDGYVESKKIQTFICCSKTSYNKDNLIVVFEENFYLNGASRKKLSNNAFTGYLYSESGAIGGNQKPNPEEYAIVHKASDGVYWQSEPVRQGNSKEDPEKGEVDESDGFLLVNCGKDPKVFFQYNIGDEQLCDNSLYDFSVDITNVDNTAGQAPVNATLLVYGTVGNRIVGSPLLELPTGDLGSGHPWETFTRSFYSGDYKTFQIQVKNNYQGDEEDVKGNDIGIDNIVFRACSPDIQIYSPNPEDGRLEYNELVLVCQDKITLEAIPTYDLSSFYTSAPYYLFQISRNNKATWEYVGTAQKEPSVEILLDETYKNGFHYRVWIGPDEEKVKKAADDNKIDNSGCRVQTAVSEPICVKYTCTNQSIAPTLSYTAECPKEGKLDLYSTIDGITLENGTTTGEYKDLSSITDPATKKSTIETYGTITWYKEGITDPVDHMQDYPEQGATPGDTYYATFTQTYGGTYTASPKSSVIVSVLPGIVVTLNKESITGCLSDLSDSDRTFEVTKIEPSSVTSPSYKWTPINADGTEGTPVENTNKYTLDPATVGSGTVKLLVKGNLGCDATKTLTYNIANNPQLQLEGVSVPCKDKIAENGIIVKLKGMSGSDALKITRTATDENGKVSTTAFTSFEEADAFKVLAYTDEAEFTFVDKYIDASYFSADFDATKITSVKYDIILGVESSNCKAEAASDIFTVSNVKEVKLSSTAINIKKEGEPVEYHICEGTDNTPNIVTVTADCELNPEETIQWYIDGEKVESQEGDIKSYTLTGLTTETEFKAVIIVDEKYEGSYETCGGEATIKIYVDAKPVVTVDDIEVCVGDDRNLSFVAKGTSCDTYTWSPITYLSDAKVSNPQVIDPKEGVIDYTLIVEKGVCTETINEIKLTVNPLPIILSITPKSEEENNSVVITMDESTVGQTFAYSLDGINYVDLPDGILENTPIGWNVLYVIDNNECTNKKEFYVEPVPINPDKYFTPNGDGNHELWTVKNLESYDSYIIEIFDRHGKRLFIQRVGSFNIDGESEDGPFLGWNGEYNGHLMPSDDYWYLITLEDVRKQYTGHFTLKR